MSLSIQFYTMLSMGAMGIWLGAAIDTYARFTPERRTFNMLTAIVDVLFWVMQALFVFYVLFLTNLGEVRVYVFLALLCGYAAYQALFKTLYLRLLHGLLSAVKAIFFFLVHLLNSIVLVPMKWLLQVVYRLSMIGVGTVWTVCFFLLKLIYRPIAYVAGLLGKATGATALLKKGQPFFKKIKDFISRLRKKDER
ncbi:spore cortex biosynthesis protein YabQ [Shouchella shacheensis]|uniref:spore cortex biosynthesis protein YabQ n=1 Tax=Shouchella shacheensis TaxID=1649580 RepID=UPI00073FAF58|nr:spore cortex biosynthesis protein YabQ [Shouchella shacheensis]